MPHPAGSAKKILSASFHRTLPIQINPVLSGCSHTLSSPPHLSLSLFTILPRHHSVHWAFSDLQPYLNPPAFMSLLWPLLFPFPPHMASPRIQEPQLQHLLQIVPLNLLGSQSSPEWVPPGARRRETRPKTRALFLFFSFGLFGGRFQGHSGDWAHS